MAPRASTIQRPAGKSCGNLDALECRNLIGAVNSCRCQGGVLKWAPPGTPLPALSVEARGDPVSGTEALAQEAEFVAFGVLQDVPLFVPGLPHVGRPGTKGQQPFQFGVLVPVHRVD